MTALSVPPLVACLVCSFALSCRSAGPYGFSRAYRATSDETQAIAGKPEYDHSAERSLGKLKGRAFWLFGVVTQRGSGPGGAAYLAVSVRSLQPQNVCTSPDENSCRVTVSDRETGRVHLLLTLAGDDELGERSVGLGSLVRVLGTVAEDVDPNDGTPVLRATFYRHWPRGLYATSTAPVSAKR